MAEPWSAPGPWDSALCVTHTVHWWEERARNCVWRNARIWRGRRERKGCFGGKSGLGKAGKWFRGMVSQVQAGRRGWTTFPGADVFWGELETPQLTLDVGQGCVSTLDPVTVEGTERFLSWEVTQSKRYFRNNSLAVVYRLDWKNREDGRNSRLGDWLERKVREGHEGRCPKRQSPQAILAPK